MGIGARELITQSDCTQFLLTAPTVGESPGLAREILNLTRFEPQVLKAAVTVAGNRVLASYGLSAEEQSVLETSGSQPWLSAAPGRGEQHLDGSFRLLTELAGPGSIPGWDETLKVLSLGAEYWRLQRGRHIRTSWIPVTRKFTSALLGEIDEEEALQLAVDLALEGANADAALLFLPGVGGVLSCEFTAPTEAQPLIGTTLNLTDSGETALASHRAAIEGSYLQLLEDPLGQLGSYGPACFVPLVAKGTPKGALLLLRTADELPFSEENAPLAENYAATVSLCLQLAKGRQAQSVAMMLEERDRIGRDLHDMGIQLLFATGMQLDRLRSEVESSAPSSRRVSAEIQSAMVNLEDAVRQIRQVVSGLKDSEQRQSFVELLEAEASRARQILGFAPSLILELDGVPLDSSNASWAEQAAELSERIGDPVAADAIATIRESLSNVAKHAGARSVKMEVAVDGKPPIGELVVSVIDDGAGINLSRTRSSGIANMSNRASYRGGSFAVGMGPRGTGTAVVWRVPLSTG